MISYLIEMDFKDTQAAAVKCRHQTWQRRLVRNEVGLQFSALKNRYGFHGGCKFRFVICGEWFLKVGLSEAGGFSQFIHAINPKGDSI